MEDIRLCLPLLMADGKSFAAQFLGVYAYDYLIAVKGKDDMSKVETASPKVHYALFKVNFMYFLVLLSEKSISGCPDNKVFQVKLIQPDAKPMVWMTFFRRILYASDAWVKRRAISM